MTYHHHDNSPPQRLTTTMTIPHHHNLPRPLLTTITTHCHHNLPPPQLTTTTTYHHHNLPPPWQFPTTTTYHHHDNSPPSQLTKTTTHHHHNSLPPQLNTITNHHHRYSYIFRGSLAQNACWSSIFLRKPGSLADSQIGCIFQLFHLQWTPRRKCVFKFQFWEMVCFPQNAFPVRMSVSLVGSWSDRFWSGVTCFGHVVCIRAIKCVVRFMACSCCVNFMAVAMLSERFLSLDLNRKVAFVRCHRCAINFLYHALYCNASTFCISHCICGDSGSS